MFKQLLFIFAVIVITSSISEAQFLGDAVRLSREPIGTGTRSLSMGGASIANANDYSALDWNPAALTLMDFGEVSLSLYFKAHSSTASFLSSSTDESVTNTSLSSIGYAAPVETKRGHLAFGLSYDRVSDYNTTYSFSAVNPNSSFLDSKGFINDRGTLPGESTTHYQNYLYDNNLAWALFLTHDADSAKPKLTTPFTSGLQESGTVTEEGGMNALRFGAGVDVAENIAVGATVNVFFGSYDYRRVLNEQDVNNIFTQPKDSLPPDNFQSAQIIDTRNQNEVGFSLKLGLLASPSEHFRVGFTFETPEVYTVNDQFQRTGSSHFRDGRNYSSTDPLTNNDVLSLNPFIVNNYTVTTPLKLAGGISFNTSGLTLSASADFSDQSQLRFSNADVDLSDLNDSARQNLKATLNWKLGAEYVIKPVGLILRGGFGMNPSPYKNDASSFNTTVNTTVISGGLGILLSKSSIAEITYRRTSYTTDHVLYNDYSVATGNAISASIPTDAVVQNQFLLSFSFRF